MNAQSLLSHPMEAVDAASPEEAAMLQLPLLGAADSKAIFSIEWAAGFVDGEACIHISRQSSGKKGGVAFGLTIHIAQNNLAVLEHFREGVGVPAQIYATKRQPSHSRQCYSLHYNGQNAMALILLLSPHLVRKRDEARLAVTFWIEGRVGLRPGSKGLPPELVAIRERLYLKMRSLK